MGHRGFLPLIFRRPQINLNRFSSSCKSKKLRSVQRKVTYDNLDTRTYVLNSLFSGTPPQKRNKDPQWNWRIRTDHGRQIKYLGRVKAYFAEIKLTYNIDIAVIFSGDTPEIHSRYIRFTKIQCTRYSNYWSWPNWHGSTTSTNFSIKTPIDGITTILGEKSFVISFRTKLWSWPQETHKES